MNKKRSIIFVLCAFIILSLGIRVSAGTVTQKLYTISSGNTRVYSNTSLTNGSGWIYGSDEVTVLEITRTYCKVNYPISGGRTKNGYVSTNALFTAVSGKSYASRAKITTYRRPGGSSYGYVSKNDSVLVLGTSGSYTQVRYPVTGGYKFAFIKTTDCKNHVLPTSTPSNSSSNGGANAIPNGWYMVVSGNSDARVLDINNWNRSNGGNLETYTKNNTSNQRFQMIYLNNGYYAIKALHSDRYLHIQDENNKTANVHQWEGCSHNNAQWALKSAGNGYYYLQNRGNGSYLDNSGGRTSPGNNVISYPYNGSNSQKWKFVSTSNGYDEKRSLPDGWYEVRSGNNNSYVWDINAGINSGKNDGANLEIYQRHGGNNQRFYLRYLNNGYYAIMAGHSNKYLHKQNSGYTDNVVQWAGYSTSAIQTQWAIASAGNGYYYVRAKAGNYVDNSGGTVKNGNNVITYMLNGSNAQKWKFVSSGQEDSKLTISGASTPGTLEQGKGFTCKGTISSNYKITKVTVGIWDQNGKQVTATSRTPNSYSYNINSLDGDVHFSYAKPGKNQYKIIATDEKTTKTLVSVWYTVKESQNGPSSYQGPYSGTPQKGSFNGRQFLVFSQNDKNWKNEPYKKGDLNNDGKLENATVGTSACHLLSLVNGTYWLSGKFIDPIWLARYAINGGYRTNGSINMKGLYSDISKNYGSKYGITYQGYSTSFDVLKTNLKKGQIAIGGGMGHVMCIAAYNSGTDKYLILDSYPSSKRDTDKTWYIWKSRSQMTGKFAFSYFYFFSR